MWVIIIHWVNLITTSRRDVTGTMVSIYFAHVAAGVSGGLIGWGLGLPPAFALPGGVVSGVIGAGLTHALWAQWPESLWAAPNDIERAARVGQLVSLGIYFAGFGDFGPAVAPVMLCANLVHVWSGRG